ncbi:Cof-type HAD-IIB family hydrolase [Gracilibacillus salinarum]|uniref:Cof-type HAD-IIB family hydrolase n=2 Tax=Gracilibacillus salinarum TaxID=2932255 RepID=A0ABY4GT75_9BACI|nr:HAD family hydrolase [Gracilibacillus salinarum]UOQ87434.1 Cof-type HAD-IIB family hydrolase [Gracilibacillus salinarum]
MNNFKALFLDIDGTILRKDHSIEASTIEAVKQAQSQGIEVFLATGRPLHEIDEIAETLQIESLIGYNGAYAVYNGKTIVNEPLDGEIIDHYLEVAKQQQHEMILYTNQLNLLTNRTKDYVKEFIDYFHLKDYQLYDQRYRDDILGITVMNVKPQEPVLYELPNESIYFSQVNVQGLEHNYDVIRESVNKGHAIQHTLKQLAIEPSQAIAFGDGLNDKQMLQAVEHSFAMGNANQELFAYAKHKTTSVEDSGIHNGLAKLGIV